MGEMEIYKILFLFLIAWQGPIIAIKAFRKNCTITTFSFLAFAIGVTGFIYLQFLMR